MKLHFAAILSTCVFVAGCSAIPVSNPDPLAQIERLSDVTLAPETTQSEAIDAALALAATPAESNDEPGFLGQLFSGPDSAGGGLIDALRTPSAPVVRTGPDARLITFGDSVPYGEIATICNIPSRNLGTVVANVSGYKIYDTNPNATTMRPHFITGFDDGCARQFSAALSMTGDVGTHEVVRYLPANRNKSFTSTDNAYEAIKASFCRVSHGNPCGARLDALAGNTTFVTAYEKFGAHPRWVEILLHDGDVKAIDFKQR